MKLTQGQWSALVKPNLKHLVPFGLAVCAIGAWALWWSDCQHAKPARALHGCTCIINLGMLESRKNRGYAYYNRANAYDNMGQVEQALADFERAIALIPNMPKPTLIAAMFMDNRNSMIAPLRITTRPSA